MVLNWSCEHGPELVLSDLLALLAQERPLAQPRRRAREQSEASRAAPSRLCFPTSYIRVRIEMLYGLWTCDIDMNDAGNEAVVEPRASLRYPSSLHRSGDA